MGFKRAVQGDKKESMKKNKGRIEVQSRENAFSSVIIHDQVNASISFGK